jgi:hypothetical protein
MNKTQTNDENNNTNQHRPASPKPLTNKRRGHSPDETSDLIDSNDQRNHIRSSVSLRIDAQRSSKSRRIDETSHEAIVVADEQKAQASQCRDRSKESIAFESRLGEHVAGTVVAATVLDEWRRGVVNRQSMSLHVALYIIFRSLPFYLRVPEFRGPHLSTHATPDGNRTVFQFIECCRFMEEPYRTAQTAR